MAVKWLRTRARGRSRPAPSAEDAIGRYVLVLDDWRIELGQHAACLLRSDDELGARHPAQRLLLVGISRSHPGELHERFGSHDAARGLRPIFRWLQVGGSGIRKSCRIFYRGAGVAAAAAKQRWTEPLPMPSCVAIAPMLRPVAAKALISSALARAVGLRPL